MLFVVLMVTSVLYQLRLTSSLPAGESWADDRIIFQNDKPWNGQRYSFVYQTLFGTSRIEKAELKENSLGIKYIDVEGEYSYPTQDGFLRKVSYRANDQGYQETQSVERNLELKVAADNHNSAVTAVDKDNFQENSFIVNPTSGTNAILKLNNDDRIFFPTEKDIELPTSTTPASVLTTVTPSMSAQNGTNITESVDYYYDELGNRVGGIPPAVLGSLLG